MKKVAFHNIYTELNRGNFMFKNENALIGDNLLKPMVEMKKMAWKFSLEVGTSDFFIDQEVDAIVFMDMPKQSNRYFQKALKQGIPLFLMVLESEIINSANYDKQNHRYFERIFTYNDAFVDNEKYFKINYSFVFPETIPQKFSDKKLCCVIAGNKKSNHPKELYSKRLEAIRWFEDNYPEDFDLYGFGWDEYQFQGPRIISLLNRIKPLTKALGPRHKTYRGQVKRKADVLSKYKFCICFENAYGIPGYITEKIFDCFFAGCVPVYLGADNIDDHIPGNCFIDFRKFPTVSDLKNFLSSMPEEDYLSYINSIQSFLHSEKSKPFTVDYFNQTILGNISEVLSSKDQ